MLIIWCCENWIAGIEANCAKTTLASILLVFEKIQRKLTVRSLQCKKVKWAKIRFTLEEVEKDTAFPVEETT